MSNTDYGELFCQAVDTIIKERIGSIPYDSTYLCTIVDDSDKKNGHYRVLKDQVEFDAYSSVTNYSKNTNVYVQVPNGDWNEQKIIVSKKVDKNTKPLTYVRPFDSFVDITGNVITQPPQISGLVANDPIRKEITVWSYNSPASSTDYKEEGIDLIGYSRMGLQASFMCWAQELGAILGSYGLRLRVEAIPEDAEDGQAIDETNYYDFIFDCADMVGNPYAFESYYQQEIIFDISNLYKIKRMELQFYEKPGSFINGQNEQIPFENLPPNIFTQDIYLSFGYDSSEFDKDTVILYSTKNSRYYEDRDPEEDNHKDIYMRWVHKFDNGFFRVVTEKDDLNYELRWYKEELGHKSDNAFSGVDWKLISKQTHPTNNLYEYDIIDKNWIDYNNIAQTASYGRPRVPEYNMTWLLPDTSKAEEAIKALVFYDDTHIISNILTFKNNNEAINQATVNATSALMINCEDETYGNYFIYNLGGKIVDDADCRLEREFKLYFNANFAEEETAAELTNAEIVEWIIPSVNTMIDIEGFIGADSDGKEFEPDIEGYYHLKRYGIKDQRYDVTKNGANTQKYKIKYLYNQAYNNNTIKCNIYKNNKIYTATKELTFGPIGTSGTDYTFVLDFDKGVTALTIGDTDKVTVTARLYNYEGREIDILNKHFNWSWVGKSKAFLSIDGEHAGADGIFENVQSSTVEVQLNSDVTSISTHDNFTVLKATLTDWGDYPLNAYLPIPIRTDKKYQFISGAKEICYNSLGYLDTYFQSPYEIHINNGLSEKDENDIIIPKLVNSTWEIYSGEEDDPYKPVLEPNSAGQYILRPINIYAKDAMTELCVIGYDVDAEEEVWSQPIYVYQNTYPSSIINEWDGSLQIDEKTNSILAAKIAAGKKHKDDNTFSGVMMGDWSGNDSSTDDPSSAEYAITENTGIYGFQRGVATFGFRDDGTAFIGKPGFGRLEFNGNKSVIESNAFASGKGGLSLDFDDGVIKMYEPNKSHNRERSIILDADASEFPFTIGSNFSVDWDGGIWAKKGTFEGNIDAISGEFSQNLKANQLEATEATFGSLYVETPYFNTVYFAPATSTQKHVTYEIRHTNGRWETVDEDVYNAYSGKKRKTTTSKGATVYGGELGLFKGHNGVIETTVVGLRNSNPELSMVIEGSGQNLRIGNNKDTDHIILKGDQIRWQTAGIVGTGQKNSSGELYQHERFVINAAAIEFSTPDPSNQTGIYARFA